jgi:GDP-L-fucose synthase
MSKDLPICVTGGKGFLGKAVCNELRRRGYTDIHQLGKADCDLRRKEEVDDMIYDMKPHKVIHLAATVGGIGANKERPGEFFYDNMAMGVNLIEECRRNEVNKFVLISTVCSYPNLTPAPFKEEDVWNGYPEPTNAPYGVAKRALMEMLSAYRKQYNFNGITLIPVNLYGPNDNFHHFNSHVIAGLLNKFYDAMNDYDYHNDVVVWGSGNASREFLYISDAAIGIVNALEQYDKPEPVNLGTGKDITIRELAWKIGDLMGFRGNLIFDNKNPDGQLKRQLDISKAKEEFGFEAVVSLNEGLRMTIEHYVKFRSEAQI